MPPASLTSFAVSFTLSLRSTAISFAPSLVNSSEAARPMPLPAPVMMTDLPSRRPMCFSPLAMPTSAAAARIQTGFQTSEISQDTKVTRDDLCSDVQRRRTVLRSLRDVRSGKPKSSPRGGSGCVMRRCAVTVATSTVRRISPATPATPKCSRRSPEDPAARRGLVCKQPHAHAPDRGSALGRGLSEACKHGLQESLRRTTSRPMAGG